MGPGRSPTNWCLYDLDDGIVRSGLLDGVNIVWGDGRGNLIVFGRSRGGDNPFEEKMRQVRRISGDDLSEQTAEFSFDGTPSGTQSYSMYGTDCLVTRRGTVIFLGRKDGILTWPRGGTVQKHDSQSGVPDGPTRAFQEGPDGRVWILRAGKILVFDPDANPDSNG
jgi:hypothetical protein